MEAYLENEGGMRRNLDACLSRWKHRKKVEQKRRQLAAASLAGEGGRNETKHGPYVCLGRNKRKVEHNRRQLTGGEFRASIVMLGVAVVFDTSMTFSRH